MRLSPDVGAPLIKAFESCLQPMPGRPGQFQPYRCPAGVLTIGWGHTNHHAPTFDASAVWPQARCDEVFVSDMAIFERHVTQQLQGARVTQAQFDALVSWSFNTGGPASSAVWPAVRAGDVDAVVERLARWRLANGKVLGGLVRRRKAEGELYRGDITAALRTAGAQRAAPVPMAQAVERPIPSPADIATRTGGQTAVIGMGGAAASGAPAALDELGPAATWVVLVLGLVFVAAGVALWIRKARKVREEWA